MNLPRVFYFGANNLWLDKLTKGIIINQNKQKTLIQNLQRFINVNCGAKNSAFS